MAIPLKYQAKEVLNKVLNAGEDALNVDLAESVTVTVDSEFPAAAAITDNFANPTTTSAMSMLMAYDGSAWDRVTIGDGTAATALRVTISTNDSHFGAVGAAADVDGVIHGQLRTIGTSLELLDNAVDGNYLDVNANIAGTDMVGGAGAVASGVQRVTLASNDPAVTSLGNLDNAVDGNYLNVNANIAGTDFVGGAGAVAGGVQRVTLASDDPAVASLDEIEGAVETIETAIKAEDASHSDGDTGIMALAVRNDVLEGLAGSDGEYSALQVNKTGALNVTETVGHLGAFYESSTTSNSGLKIVAIQFLEDTKFSLLTPATSDYIGNTGSGGDDIAAGDVFPQGMTIFGRWTAFQLVSGGRVIAYNGDW